MSFIFSDPAVKVLEKYLDAAYQRQEVTANNIANINTPGYKKSYVVFEEFLAQALKEKEGIPLRRTHPAHMGSVPALEEIAPEIRRDYSTSHRTDGNNVSIEEEMAVLAMNAINYNLAAQQLSNKLSLLRYVITEGRG
ncbi:MAG: Flagellar basal body rod protein FlgB [Clostridia bacterium 41_269]|nr:MAG: Flagellar basal body rod protein FlgB [Clostridia bacterium 41_269]